MEKEEDLVMMDRRLQERVESVMAAEPREPGASP